MSVGLDRTVQQDFSAGMFRSVAPELIPENGAWDIVNGLLTEDGAIFRRGGTDYRSTTVGGAPLVMWDGTLATGGQQTIIARNGGLSRMSSAGTITSLGTGTVTVPGRAVGYSGVVYLPGGATYDGATVGTAAKVAPYYAVVANRLLAASGDRVDFSDIGTPGTFGATNFHLIPGGVRILGVQGLRDSAAVFTTDGLWLISNMAYELTDDFGNVQHRLDHYSSEIVLWGDQGLAPWAGGLIVPGTDAIWQVSLGVESDATQPFTEISGPIQSMYREYVREGFQPGGAVVFNNHYILPIVSGVNVVDMLVCRLDVKGRPWSRLTGFGSQGLTLARRVDPVTRRPDLLIGHQAGRILDGGWFSPSPSSEADADGSGYSWSVTTRDYSTGNFVPNTVVKLRASYQLEDTDGSDPSIDAFDITSRISTTGTKWGQFQWGTGVWSPGGTEAVSMESLGTGAPEDAEGDRPFTWPVRRKARFVRFRLRSSSTTSWLSLRALELFVRSSGRI
jgi:hypothetical protein